MTTRSSQAMCNDQTPLLALPKELLQEIVSNTTISPDETYPWSLIELSKTCRYLYLLVHQDPWRQVTLWPRAFRARFDASAIYRRQLHQQFDWQTELERRYKALESCRQTAHAASLAVAPTWSRRPREFELAVQLDKIDWKSIWDMIIEHDDLNIPLLLKHQVHLLAGVAFQSSAFRGREAYPVILPILSLLVNYDFSLTQFFASNVSSRIVTQELSQFAYDSQTNTFITNRMAPRPFHSEIPTQEENDDGDSTPQHLTPRTPVPSNAFYPSQDLLPSAFHLFFTTIFAQHPDLYQVIPECTPIPLFPLQSKMFDVEFLRRYERQLFDASLHESRDTLHDKQQQKTIMRRLDNIYADTGFASSTHFVSEAHLIEGDWMGYYSYFGIPMLNERFDGPMRLTLRIVPLEAGLHDEQPQTGVRLSRFPDCHLRTCPLTRFEGTGVDNLGGFRITGLIDDSEDGQVTWEKTYIDFGITWEYTGRFLMPMGLCGRWGDQQNGGPWWIWKVNDPPANESHDNLFFY